MSDFGYAGGAHHALDEPVGEVSAVSGPVTDAPAAKRSSSLLLSGHDEILKENAEVEQFLASPLSVQVQSYLSKLPSSRSKKHWPTGGSTKIISQRLLHLPEPTSLLHVPALKVSTCLAWMEM